MHSNIGKWLINKPCCNFIYINFFFFFELYHDDLTYGIYTYSGMLSSFSSYALESMETCQECQYFHPIKAKKHFSAKSCTLWIMLSSTKMLLISFSKEKRLPLLATRNQLLI